MDGIDELAPLVGVRVACRTLGVARSTYYRSQQPPAPPRLSPPRRPHPRALSSDEPAAVHKGQAAAVSAARRQTLERGLCPPPRTLCGRTTHATAGASGGMDQPATPAAANGDYGHGDRGSGAGSVVGQAWPLSASAVTTGFVFFKKSF